MQAKSGGGELDARVDPRTNLFMAATLLSGERSLAVKIRDLSASGAQIEGCDFPEVGSAMTLVRGRLSVGGHITWSAERRCGLHFSTRISVPAWMAGAVNGEQQRVDHVVALLKAGALPLAKPGHPHAPAVEGLADDLKRLSRLLEMLADALAGDPAIVTAHGVTLQNLDIALQTLTALVTTVEGDDSGEVARSLLRLEELRLSATQALDND